MNQQDRHAQDRPAFPAPEALLGDYQLALEHDDAARAEEAALRFFAHAIEEASREPSQDLLLKLEAHRREEAGDWEGAEAAYRQGLTLATAEASPMAEFKARHDLCRLYEFLGQSGRALEASLSAVEVARRADRVGLMVMALEQQAGCRLAAGDGARALAAADELLQILPDDTMYDLQRGRALVLRARCGIGIRPDSSVHDDLNAAMGLLAPMSGASMFAGVQSGLAQWWEVTARLRSARGDTAGAADAWGRSVEFRRAVSGLPQLEGPYRFAALARALQWYADSLAAAGEVGAAEDALAESRVIRRAIRLPAEGKNLPPGGVERQHAPDAVSGR